MNTLFEQGPNDLRQGYCASGQSEAVDKIVKSIWTKNKTSNHFITFEGNYFGIGSFCSRALSEESSESLFPVTKAKLPNIGNFDDDSNEIEALLKKGKYLGVFIEPTRQKFMDSTPIEFLNGLREITDKYRYTISA